MHRILRRLHCQQLCVPLRSFLLLSWGPVVAWPLLAAGAMAIGTAIFRSGVLLDFNGLAMVSWTVEGVNNVVAVFCMVRILLRNVACGVCTVPVIFEPARHGRILCGLALICRLISVLVQASSARRKNVNLTFRLAHYEMLSPVADMTVRRLGPGGSDPREALCAQLFV